MKTNDLGNDRIRPLVLKLALPSMLAQLINVLTALSIVFLFPQSHRSGSWRWPASACAGRL
jgi:hypothetical protein